jgi:IS1 family transposase
MRATFKSFWVRKLTGKPAFLTIADSESEARRIHFARFTPYVADSKVFRTHSDSDSPDRFTASATGLYSSVENRACTRIPRNLAFGTFGLPIFVFINSLCTTKIIVDIRYFPSYAKSTIKNDMANILKTEKKVAVVSMLAEGSSMAAIARITGIHPDTIMRLGVRIGQACAKIQDEKMRGLTCNQIEVDEIWGFIGAKRNNAKRAGAYGDVWTFIALDADTKLIPSFVVGKRDLYHARAFMEDLAGRLSRRVQITSDALASYPEAIESGFGSEVDYGQLVKTYGVVNLNKDAASRYSPAEVVKTERTVITGMPDVRRITTSHVEKQNHTLRMHCRRLTRLTNAFSKKFENFEAAVALNFAYYNFCKTHKALRMTPAMAAGIETSYWTVEQLVKNCGE